MGSNVIEMPQPRRRRVNKRELARVTELRLMASERERAQYERQMRTLASRIEELLDEIDRISATEDERLAAEQ